MKRYGGAGQNIIMNENMGVGLRGRVLKPTSCKWKEGPYIGPYA
jgi:hypothetical protein